MRTSKFRSTCRPRSSAAAATLAAALVCWAPAHAADDVIAQFSAGSTARQTVVLDAVVNGRAMGSVFAVSERGQVIAVDAAALRAWRVTPARAATFDVDDRSFVAISDLPGAKINLDQRAQRLLLELPPQLFAPSELQFPTASRPALSPVVPAGVFNYTLFGYTSKASSYGSGFFEAGVSGAPGSLIATASANTAAPAGQTTHQFVRYDTTYRRDDPSGLRTLLVGDSFTQPGSWGRSIRFGGLQYGTNFSLQPDLITYPLQGFTGTAVVPSTVDVFVNGSRIAAQPVESGPFTLNNVPLVSGAGDVQLVVRDAFGQQQVITQPFYANRRLLREGMQDFQFSAGAIRENYGLDSFDYGEAMGWGYWRSGLSNGFTLEVRGEGDRNVRAGGVTGDVALGLFGTATLGAALSEGRAGTGWLGVAGYEYIGRGFNFAARSYWASTDFRSIGDDNLPVVQRQSFVAAGTNFGRAGSLGLAWASQHYRVLPSIDTVALTYTATVVPNVFLTMSVSRSYSVIDQTSAFATLNFALGGRTSAGVEASSTRGGGDTTSYLGWSVQQTLPTDQGFGYRLRATTQEQVDAGLAYTWAYGTYALEASSYKGENAARATATGGLGFINGYTFASRPITESFGLVQVGDVEGVRVFHEGNPIGQTDGDGRIVINRMTPYVANRITIEERDLPMDVSIRSREQRAAPQFRSGILIDYEARRRVSVSIEVLGLDGKHLPVGTEVALADSALRFVVGDNGEMFVPDMPSYARFVTRLQGRDCAFEVRLAAAPPEAFSTLGPYQCR
jgi:outer membrane usher protein